MKTKDMVKMLDEVSVFYNQGDLNNAKDKLLAILQVNNINYDNFLDCSAEQSRLIGITFSSLALIADRDANDVDALASYNKSIEYYQQSLTKASKSADRKNAEYDISGLLYNKSVIYQNLKFKEKDGNYDVEKVKEYTALERQNLLQAASGRLNIEEKLSDEMRHRIATIYYNLAKNYESDNDLTEDLTLSLNEAQKYYKLSLGFANKVSSQYMPAADVFSIEETRADIKKALRGIGNLLNIPSEEIESDTSKERTEKVPSKSERIKAPSKKASAKPELRSVASLNTNISNGLARLSQYVERLEDNPDSRLWLHQKACLNNVSIALNSGIKHGYVNMATGTGKTTEFATLIKEMGMETIVVAPTNILVKQIAEEIQKKAPSLDIGMVDGTHKRKGNNVTVITYASFEKMHQLDAFKNVKLVVLDEVHSSLSQKRINAIEYFKSRTLPSSSASSIESFEDNSPIIIGFTATDQFNSARKDGDYTNVNELLPHKFFEYSIGQGIEERILHPCKIDEIYLDDAINGDLKRILRKKKKKDADADLTAADLEILKQEEINRVITDLICNIPNPENRESLYGKSGLVFAIDIGHAESIAAELNHALGDNYAASIHSKMSKAEQEIILAKHKSGEIKTLVNVDMLTVGYDDKQLKYIIDFRPTKSEIRLTQTFGRLTRKDDTNPEAKTYIQLVIPDMNMKASDLFDGRTRLGEINTRAFDRSEALGKDMEVGSHCHYQVKFSDGSIRERAIEKINLGIRTSTTTKRASNISSIDDLEIDWDTLVENFGYDGSLDGATFDDAKDYEEMKATSSFDLSPLSYNQETSSIDSFSQIQPQLFERPIDYKTSSSFRSNSYSSRGSLNSDKRDHDQETSSIASFSQIPALSSTSAVVRLEHKRKPSIDLEKLRAESDRNSQLTATERLEKNRSSSSLEKFRK